MWCYSLSVIGDGLFNDDLYIKNNLIVSQNAQINDHLYVYGDTFLNDTLTVDNVIVNGTTIGHTDDTDLITLADGIATVAGEISVTNGPRT